MWRCAQSLTRGLRRIGCGGSTRAGSPPAETTRPRPGITRLRLDLEEGVGGQALQLQLGSLGRDAYAVERASRVLVCIHGLRGPEAVYMPLLDGSRGPGERVFLIRWGEPGGPAIADQPWPG